MTEPYLLWALLVGLAVGVALTWFALGRLPRRTDDVGPEERILEASWISSVLAGRGRPAPEPLVEEVLELHEQYVSGPAPSMTPAERESLAAERTRRAEQALREQEAVEALRRRRRPSGRRGANG